MATTGESGREEDDVQRVLRYSDIDKEPLEMLIPIGGYEDMPIVPLEIAVEPLVPFLPSVEIAAYVAKERCKNPPDDGLTLDESASIMLYSMGGNPVDKCLYVALNATLRSADRNKLKPWFSYLKLFLTALSRLPSIPRHVYRGIKLDLSAEYQIDRTIIWWGFSSCTTSINALQEELFLGKTGTRTMFNIDCVSGKDIQKHSCYPKEAEILLLAGTKFEVIGCLDQDNGLRIIQLKETKPPFPLLHPVISQNSNISYSNDSDESIQLKTQEKLSSSPKSCAGLTDLVELVKSEYMKNARIERIMNPAKSFSIEHSYINLAIVKKKEQDEKEKQLHNTQQSNAIMGTYEEIYGSKTTIDVKDIFETCKNQEKQVLVFGRAGIGKSTFCRYVAYQWATGSYWSQYELLALIPLRRLTTDRYPPGKSYSLIDLVIKEVFSFDLSEKDEKLLKKKFDARKILWILDGYDEIVQHVPPHLEPLFEQLLKTPHHILTSRPYLNTLSYNVQMEITGFTDDNIEKYVQQFFDQMKDELDNVSTKSQKLLSFLNSNSSICGVAHIPVNLELICSLWSNQDWSETEQLTITTLYDMITEWLCRRYLTPTNKKLSNLSKDDIDLRCKKELTFLESLAFDVMEKNTIIIRPSSLNKALVEAKVTSKENPHILNIGILKSFHKQGTGSSIEMNKDHYFVHLSFQEYFAARYLINTLDRGPAEKAIQFIKHQKYNQRYALVFIFAAGLLSESDTKSSLHTFWDNILGQPLDLVGIRHLQLVISCLHESAGKSTASCRTELLLCIAESIKHNVLMKNETIWKHLSQSLRRAQSVACDQTITNLFVNLLQSNDTDLRSNVLEFIAELKLLNPSITLITSVTSILDDKDTKLSRNAYKALRSIGEKAATTEVINKLLSALGDERQDVRWHASETLAKMGEKAATNEVINKLVSALEDESKDVRSSACFALGMMGEKAATNEVINKLVSALGDESEYVRRSASKTLVKMGEEAAINEVINKLASALKDKSKYVRSSACETLGNIGEKAATNEVINKLVSTLGDESQYVRRSASEALVKMGKKAATNEVINKLASALKDKSKYVRSSACEALRNIGEKAATNEVINKLTNALGDKSEGVRSSAYYALGSIGEKAATNEVINKLVSMLGDKRKGVGGWAWQVLKMMGGKAATNEVINKLVSELGDESEYVRSSACEVLGKMSDKAATNEVINKLASALEDESEYVRRCACCALREMGEKAATNEVINKLVSTLEDEREDVRRCACNALVEMGKKAATNEVINKLASALEDESQYVRSSACEALGNIGEKAATNEVINKLTNALGDKSEGVRSSAYYALGSIGEKAATNEVIDRLVSALGDETEYVRNSACEVLGKMGDKAATNEVINKLVSALGDESEYVRSSACEALVKMGEKVAMNEGINKLMVLLSNDFTGAAIRMKEKFAKFCGSPAVMAQVDPKVFLDLCVDDFARGVFENVSMKQLLGVYFATKNPAWLATLSQYALLEGVAVITTDNKVVLYDSKEPLELYDVDLKLREQLIEVFIRQARRLYLSLEMPQEACRK